MKTATRGRTFLLSCILFIMPVSYVEAQSSPAEVPAAPIDIVTLKDGSVIFGEVVEMSDGLLHLKSAAAGDLIKIKWAEVIKLKVSHPIPFHLKEGTVLIGTTEEGPPGTLILKAGPLQETLTVPLESVTSVNPIAQPPVIYAGSISGGFSQASGNSRFRNASLLGDFVARSKQLRLSINGRYVYGDTNDELTARNARGTIKLDFFITKRFYWFASAYVENDRFQDLKMRTALASGPGYQFIDRGDYNGIFKDLTFYTEAGLAYFNEDFLVAEDKATTRARVSMKLDWPLFDGGVTIYHYNEIYPSLENGSDFYLTMDNGVRFKVWQGLVSGIQVTTRYNNNPPSGTGDTDNLYLFTLGYSFDTTRKR